MQHGTCCLNYTEKSAFSNYCSVEKSDKWGFIMADNNRSRLLLLLKYLQQNTDDEHVASVADITEMLETKGINGNRNTIRDDV